jgi:hypothetical protein
MDVDMFHALSKIWSYTDILRYTPTTTLKNYKKLLRDLETRIGD